MGKIVLLVSREDMLHQAHNILQEKKFRIHEMRVIETKAAVMEARQSIADGASILIARGLQASLIKQYTDIPVVEIVLTAQEMALLVMRAKQIIEKPKPVIAVVGFKNMFCDMSYFDELYEIELRTYYAEQGAELPAVSRRAVEDGVDLIIGGDTAVAAAASAGIPSLFLSLTEDSLRQAFSMAENMDYAMSVEKKTAAQMDTLLDYSPGGVIRMDSDGVVTAVNPLLEDMIGRPQTELTGRSIREIAPQIGEEALRQVFSEGKEYALFLEWNRTSVFAVIAPVLCEERVESAIITCRRMKKRMETGAKAGKGRNLELPPLMRFEDIFGESKAMTECIRLAGLYALSEQPVVIRGEAGTEIRMVAESIHNSSIRENGPFLDVPCEGLSGVEQRKMIFGERGAALQAEGGSLLIQDVDELTADNQYRLYQMIRLKCCHDFDTAGLRKVNVRVFVTVRRPFAQLLEEGRVRGDLYYLLSGLELFIPPLRERSGDLQKILERTVKACCERYSRYHVLTEGGKAALLLYPWPGNLLQIESFCERLILTAGKRSIDEIAVNRLLKELYPEPVKKVEHTGLMLPAAQYSEEARRIVACLKKYGGSREKTAAELGISKATLWRHMKKYDIDCKNDI